MDNWSTTFKLYHYKEYLEAIENIINPTSWEIQVTDLDSVLPQIQRMRNRTYYIMNTQPELARGVKTIADCLKEVYSTPSLMNKFHITTLYIITSRFLGILKWARGEVRKNKLEDLKIQVEEQKPPAQHTFTRLINSVLNM